MMVRAVNEVASENDHLQFVKELSLKAQSGESERRFEKVESGPDLFLSTFYSPTSPVSAAQPQWGRRDSNPHLSG